MTQAATIKSSPPAPTQIETFRSALNQSPVVVELLHRARDLKLPDWYLAAGCLAQTVWNVATGCPPEAGLRDYDIPYFDSGDLSWEAEDLVIQAANDAFTGISAVVQVRNEARVHLWYEGRFGVRCSPYDSTQAAIATFPTTASCVGVRLNPDDSWEVYAPYGLSDLLEMVVRPNVTLSPRHIYEAKMERWRRQWPSLTILPWPETDRLAPG